MKIHALKPILICSALLAASSLLLPGCSDKDKEKEQSNIIRIGHFPNITHVHALVARNMARNGKDWFAERVPGYKLEWFVYNAGPAAMEAYFARSLDMTYVGPSPAINAFAKSKGLEARIVAGAVNGASALLVQPDSHIKGIEDFLGKTVASPQPGNTQDVACRAWFKNGGFKISLFGANAPEDMKQRKHFTTPSKGVDVTFQAMANPEMLNMFKQKKIDAAWTVEPWLSLIEQEAGGEILVEETSAVTTVLTARAKWLKDNPETAAQMVKAHQELTDWIVAHPEEAQKMVADELQQITKTSVSPELVAKAWKRLIITNEISKQGIEDFVKSAQDAGFLEEVPPIDKLISPTAQ